MNELLQLEMIINHIYQTDNDRVKNIWFDELLQFISEVPIMDVG